MVIQRERIEVEEVPVQNASIDYEGESIIHGGTFE
jgi:hypothetical protein